MLQLEFILFEFNKETRENRPRIFIVDDDPDISLTFKIGLEQHGFVVDVFSDPTVALSTFKAGIHDIPTYQFAQILLRRKMQYG